ncbi:MAG: YCF48-related protein, partial [Bacteroidota bacterium]
GALLDNMGNAHSAAFESASDVTPVTASSEVTAEGAVIQKLNGDEILFEVLADTVKFRALVRNFGTLPETTYQVRWTLDGTVQATLNNPRILGVGGRDTLLLQWNNAAPGTHLLKAWTLLAADQNRVNDTTSMTIIGPATIPAGIYNNGPVITGRVSGSGVAAPAGFRWSELQAVGSEANSGLGFSDARNSSSRFRLADDFTVPTGQTWRIDSLVTYSYQQYDQGYATPFTSANVRVWRGTPDSAGSTVVFGDTLTNRLTTSYNSRIYRISNSTTPAPGTLPDFSRVLYQNTMSAGVTLVPGRYFIDWQTVTDLNNSHFSPTVTVPNRRGNAAWNARQRATNGVWSNVLDAGNPSAAPDSAQDFPFVLIGATGAVAAHDIGVASAVQLPSADTVRFRASVWNFGASPETTYQVRWSIDGAVQATIPNSRILAVGGIDTVQLNWTAPTPGSHTLRAWTILGTDANLTNDTVTVRFNVSAGWTFNNSGTGNVLNSVKAVDRNVGWAGGNAGTVLRTVDGGITWRSVGTTTISGDVYAVEALDSTTAFVTTTPSTTRIYRTTNGGTTWTSVFTQTGGFIDAIKMYNATTGIALGDPVTGKWTILKTTNGGAAWARIATEPTAIAGQAGLNNSLATFDTTHIWFGTTAGTVYRSTDAGLTWASSATTFTGQVDEVAFNGTQFGVAGGQDAASRTTNGGTTWTAINIGGSGFVLGLAATGNNDFWAAQGDNVYRSTNRGATWSTSYTGTIGTLRHLDFVVIGPTTRGWTVSATGGIAAGLLTLTGVKEGNDRGTPTSFALDQNYPNPFNPTTTLRYALPKDARVNLTIYNVLGQRIAVLSNEVRAAGFYDVLWNGRNDFGSQVASGVYFYRIEAQPVDGSETFTNLKKMLPLK